LDHYGNNGDGWDSEGWMRDYVNPLLEQVRPLVDEHQPDGASWRLACSIGEKGHIDIRVVDQQEPDRQTT
jgi:hypothetical protein